MPISHVQLFSVPVSDQERAKAFYVDMLGFELLRESPMGPMGTWVQLGLPGGDTSITLTTWFDTMPAGSLRGMVLEVEDLDAMVAELEAKGLEFDHTVNQMPWGRYVSVQDPDGNGIALQTTTV